ncbi:MAG: LytTR family transcriptional regulator, partial [Alphaproteobacteria bacterium]|nr:LytTR family transcriptional regulator [Alphaproteobacteria bacterium]
MLLLGPLGFAAPWVLAALVALPVLWVILRAMPPAPKRIIFPGVALLAGLVDRAPVARRTPWWLLVLRLAAVAALILAFAGPVWRPVVQPPSEGPLLVVLDAGWAAAPDWAARQTRAERTLAEAATAGRPAALILADGRGPETLEFQPADSLIARLRGAQPAAWPSALPADPGAALASAPQGQLETLWLTDGTEHDNRLAWLEALSAQGSVTVVPPARPLRTLSLAAGDTPSLSLHATDDAAPDVLAIGPDPQGIERELARLTPGVAAAEDGLWLRPVAIDLPPELRNRITRFRIEGETHAGAVVLADDRVRRRKVGLVGDPAGQAEGQQLLAQTHYLRQALAPSADLVEGGLGDVLDTAPDVIILADQVQLAEIGELADWVNAGGLLIRFAGPRMAASERLMDELLLPVALRQGGRDIGGALSWGDPRGLAPF